MVDAGAERLPDGDEGAQRVPPLVGERVVATRWSGGGLLPGGVHPATTAQPGQERVERALGPEEDVVTAERAGDVLAVGRPAVEVGEAICIALAPVLPDRSCPQVYKLGMPNAVVGFDELGRMWMDQGVDVRASDAERQVVVDRLRRAVGDGLITLDEFAESSGQAYAAVTRAQLDRALAELERSEGVWIRSIVGINHDAVFGSTRAGWHPDLPDACREPFIPLLWLKILELLGRAPAGSTARFLQDGTLPD